MTSAKPAITEQVQLDLVKQPAANDGLREALTFYRDEWQLTINGAEPTDKLWHDRGKRADAALSSPMPAEVVTIKPLEWVKHPTAQMWRAETQLGLYQAIAVSVPFWAFEGVLLSSGVNKSSGNAASADAAKSAAQSDYETRICSCLVPHLAA